MVLRVGDVVLGVDGPEIGDEADRAVLLHLRYGCQETRHR